LEPKKNNGLVVGYARNNARFASSGMVLTLKVLLCNLLGQP